MLRRTALGGLVAGLLPAVARGANRPAVNVAVGSVTAQYLPISVAIGQGLFEAEGIDLTLHAFEAGGSKALEALIGGSAQMAVGLCDHLVQMQVQRKPLRGIVLFDDLPGAALAVRKDLATEIDAPAKLKGRKVGITAPGSASQFQLGFLAGRFGVKLEDMVLVPVGSGATAVAAIERKAIDALMGNDPALTILQSRGAVSMLLDARTVAGTEQAFGGRYPAGCIYTTAAFADGSPDTVQRVATALVRALRFIRDSTPAQVAAVVPKQYMAGSPALFEDVIRNNRAIYSRTGRFDEAALDVVRQVVVASMPAARSVDLSQTYTNRFVEAAP